MSQTPLQAESSMLPLNDEQALHLQRLRKKDTTPDKAILLLHGQMESGRIFYSSSAEHGLGPYLAGKGFDVFIPDLRGHGKSTPATGPKSTYGQTDWLTTDLPTIFAAIKKLRGTNPSLCLGHSWGGVMLLSFLARYPHVRDELKGIVCVSSRRRISKKSLKKFYAIDLLWNFLGSHYVKKHGYLPLSRSQPKREDASRGEYQQSRVWLKTKSPWIDVQDGFNYGSAIRQLKLPPLLFLTGQGDSLLGNEKDVRLFMREVTGADQSLKIIGTAHGFRRNYDHIDILTHRRAAEDHFPLILNFLNTKTA